MFKGVINFLFTLGLKQEHVLYGKMEGDNVKARNTV